MCHGFFHVLVSSTEQLAAQSKALLLLERAEIARSEVLLSIRGDLLGDLGDRKAGALPAGSHVAAWAMFGG